MLFCAGLTEIGVVLFLFLDTGISSTNSHLVSPGASRAASPVEIIETFDPPRPSLSPGDSIFLPIGKVAGYMDGQIFPGAGLHGSEWPRRYWLPSLLHEYVALHFIPQASHEKAGQMHISSAPDVVTHIFMLFRGVHSDDVGPQAHAATRATEEDGATF